MAGTMNFAFVHGGGQGGWVWEQTLAALKLQAGGDVSAHAFDLAGCGGKRGEDVSALTTRDVAAAFTAELAASGLVDVVLVGHSAAGQILPIAAVLRPDLIRRIIYVSCSAPPPGESVMELFGTGEQGRRDDEIGWPGAGGLAGDPATRARLMFCNDMAQADADAFLARLGDDRWPTLAAVSDERNWRYDHLAVIPSTYIVCLRDLSLPPAWQERFAERFEARRRVQIDAGHQVMNTRPHALAEVLLAEATLDSGEFAGA